MKIVGLFYELPGNLLASFLAEMRTAVVAPEHLAQLQLFVHADDLEMAGRRSLFLPRAHSLLILLCQLVMGHVALTADNSIFFPNRPIMRAS